MNPINPAIEQAVQRGMECQLQQWRAAVLTSGLRLGWKLGFSDHAAQQRMGLAEPLIGFLRRDRRLPTGGNFVIPDGAIIKVEVEIALRLGRDLGAGATREEAEAAIAALAPAVEVVNVTQPLDGVEALLAGNLYHAAVVIGPEQTTVPTQPRDNLRGHLYVNDQIGCRSESPRLPEHLGDVVRVVAETLARHGERLRAGDWIIGGSIVEPQIVVSGDHLRAEIAPLGAVTLRFSAP